MPSLWPILCWRFLHLCLQIFYSFNALRLRLSALWFALPFFHHQQVSIHQFLDLKKRSPKTVAIVLDSEEARNGTDKVVELIRWLKKVGVCHVELYDMEGIMKTSQGVLESKFYHSEDEVGRVQFYHHKMGQSNGLPDDRTPAGRSIINSSLATEAIAKTTYEKCIMAVELLSVEDGKEAVVIAARNLCSNVQKEGLASLSEADLDESMSICGVGGPDPELLIIFGATNCLLGFPPWRIRLTEIL